MGAVWVNINEIRLAQIMKKFLYCTDLQIHNNGLQFVVDLARDFNAQIVALHTWSLPIPASDSAVMPIPADVDKMVEQQQEAVEEICMKIREGKYPDGTSIKCSPIASMDKPVSGIIEEAERIGADLIIMGSREVPGILKWFGTTTTIVAEKSKVPVLIIPDNLKFRKFSEVIYATDLSEEPARIQEVIDFIRDLKSLITVLHVNNSSWEGTEKMELAIFEERVRPETDYKPLEFTSVTNKKVGTTICDFMMEHHGRLLILFKNHYSLISSMIHHSVCENLVYKSRFPILIMPG